MLINLVQVTTKDGIRLDGSYQEPSIPSSIGMDAFVLIHGTGGNFYSSTLFDAVAATLLQLGCGVLRINTRGHDGISTAVSQRGGIRLGAAYELVDDCRHDITAWLDWLKQRSGPRVGLIGHSLGAVKSLYALAQEPRLSVARAIAISPPRLSYSWFCSSGSGGEFLDTIRRAEKMVETGNPGSLMEVKLPLPFVISAAGYLEKYGPAEPYNFLKFLPSIPCPAFITLGELEVTGNMAFQGLPQAIGEISQRQPKITAEIISGADHFYTGVRSDLLTRMETWLRKGE